MLPIPGADLENVFTLRTPDDANKIAENIGGKNVVIVGSSFIGECFHKVLSMKINVMVFKFEHCDFPKCYVPKRNRVANI